MGNIKYSIKPQTGSIKLPDSLGFGQIFTDHVFEMDYTPAKGWHNPEIKPLASLTLHPASMFMHYGQAIFEGMKAFKQINDDVVLFRPDKHFERLNRSAARLCMPQVDIPFVIEALKELVAVERNWIPEKEGESLYIRPFMIGMDSVLGVKPSQSYKFIILLSPVGAYYPEGFKPVKILVQDDFVRAVRKGMGECKTPGNYAASLLAAEQARKIGYTQVLWLDGVEQKYIEEVGTMNIFITMKDEVVTPKLTGGILPGITRMSVIHMLRDWGMTVNERTISLAEFMEKYDRGEILGVFGTGTAAIISSVGEMLYKDKKMAINDGKPGKLALQLFEAITGIHTGKNPDTYNWLTQVQQEVPVS